MTCELMWGSCRSIPVAIPSRTSLHPESAGDDSDTGRSDADEGSEYQDSFGAGSDVEMEAEPGEDGRRMNDVVVRMFSPLPVGTDPAYGGATVGRMVAVAQSHGKT
jgi:hypothetical protein